MTGYAFRRYEQFETSPEAIEQELRPAVCERQQADRFKEHYSIDDNWAQIQHNGTLKRNPVDKQECLRARECAQRWWLF